MRRRIVVLGATGLTGRLVAAELAGRDRVVLAGRRAEALQAIGEAHDLPTVVTELDGLAGVLHPGDVLLSAVGPYDVVGEQVVRTAIRTAVTYVDVSGEPAFLGRVYGVHGAAAATAGVTLLPAVGYEHLPGHLVAEEALRDAGPTAAEVLVAYLVDGGLTGGALSAGSASARRSLVRALARPTATFRGGRLREEPVGARSSRVTVAGARHRTTSLGGAEVWTLPRRWPALRTVDVHTGWFGPLSPVLGLSSRLSGPYRLLQADRVVDRALAALGDGDAAHLRSGRSRVVAVVRDDRGRVLAQRDAVGGNPIVMAARLAATVVDRLAERDLRTLPVGATDPLAVFGVEGLAEVGAWAGLVTSTGR